MVVIPLKWKKYLILCEHKICSLEYITSRIKRFSTNELNVFFTRIENEMLMDSREYEAVQYIVKLVQNDAYYKLPNYKVHSLEEIDRIRIIFSEIGVRENFNEVWFCKNLRSHGQTIMAGRLCLYETENYIAHVIECIWNESPRVIDSYNKNIDITYLRAERFWWGYHYSVNELNMKAGDDADRLMKQFIEVAVQIERRKDRIANMFDSCKKEGLSTVSFEFLYDGKLNFIDWDSGDDFKMLRLI